MTLHLSKQQSCYADLDGRGDCGEAPCSFSWHQQHQSSHHRDHHHHHRHCQRHHYGSIPRGATLPRRGGARAGWHLDGTSRSPSRLAAVRAKGGSCDLWPSECGCIQRWQEPYQVSSDNPTVTAVVWGYQLRCTGAPVVSFQSSFRLVAS